MSNPHVTANDVCGVPAVTIKPLTVNDENILWSMLVHAAHEPSLDSVKGQSCLTRYVKGWGRSGDMGYVATSSDGQVHLGAAWVRLWQQAVDESDVERGFGYMGYDIPELAVATIPTHRGCGIGTLLLKAVLEEVRIECRFRGVSLSVRAGNPAVRLYKRLGFVTVNGSEKVNRTGGTSFIMLYDFKAR